MVSQTHCSHRGSIQDLLCCYSRHMGLLRSHPMLFFRSPRDISQYYRLSDLRVLWEFFLDYLDCRFDSIWYTLTSSCFYQRFQAYCDMGVLRSSIEEHELDIVRAREELDIDDFWGRSYDANEPFHSPDASWNFFSDSD